MPILGVLASSVQKAVESFDSIATQTLSSSVTSVTFNSIPSTYKDLHVRYVGKKVDSGITDINLTFNGDGGSNYSKSWIFSFDGAGPYESGSDSGLSLGYMAGTPDSGVFGAGIIDIPDYASTNKNKTCTYLTGNERSSSNTTTLIIGAGQWRSTAAISSLTLSCGPGFASGSTFEIYGIKG
jgi:hypothetical protein